MSPFSLHRPVAKSGSSPWFWLGATVGVGMLACLFSLSPLGQRLELNGFNALTLASPAPGRELPIVIVGIDEPSFAQLQRPWPWPRSLHGELVRRLKAAGARVVGFDVVFAEPSRDQEEDRAFAEAIAEAGNVVLAADMAVQDADQYQLSMRVEPLARLRQAGARAGLASVSLDGDLVVRRIPGDGEAFWRQVLAQYQGGPVGPGDSGQLLRYLGADHSLRYVSYYQALDPEQFLPPGIFAGKIVLVGHDAKVSLGPESARGDAFVTPFTGVTGLLTPGVEIHGSFIANALTGSAVAAAPVTLRLLFIGLVTLAMGAALVTWELRRGALAALGLLVVCVALPYALFAWAAWWLPSLTAMAAVVVLYGVRAVLSYVREHRLRQQIERAFRQYVAPEIVAEMSAHPERLVLGGVRRELTLMFTDLAGFTRLSEQLPPEQVAALLNETLTRMTRIILAQGGTVDKFIGDAIMAFWGAPLEDGEQARHACEAAWEMQAAMAALRQEYAEGGLPALHMRIGIHSGPAVVGNMGSVDRFDYTAIGDTVNLAARLEGVNKFYGTAVLVSEATAAQLPSPGEMAGGGLRQVDRVIVKGKTQAIAIYTFCADPALIAASDRAFACYVAQDWQGARDAYAALLANWPEDPIAPCFLARIATLSSPHAPPLPGDWDGSTSLEKG